MSEQSIMSHWLARKNIFSKTIKETHIVIRPCEEKAELTFMDSRKQGLYVLDRNNFYWNSQIDELLLKTYKAPYLLAEIKISKIPLEIREI